MNNTLSNNYKGYVGFAVRQLSDSEAKALCSPAASSLASPPITSTVVDFDSNFYIRVLTLGCYFYDTSSSKWSSEGIEVVEDGTNLTTTRCKSTHLTEFAGGFVVVPASIDFQYVFANASFAQNPIIYATVIGITCLFILMALWARYMDIQDVKRLNLVYLKDNSTGQEGHLYEVVVFTGNRKNAGTKSKVSMIISGDKKESGVRCLEDRDEDVTKRLFQRSSIDSFILSCPRLAAFFNSNQFV